MTEIAGKSVLITGGASGIGRLTALKMARRGARTIIWDIDPEALAACVEEFQAVAPEPVHGYVCDVSQSQCVHETAEQVRRDTGGVDILVNNAGVVSGKRFLQCSDEQIRRTIDVNAMALFWTGRAFLPDMIRAGTGHVVTIASAAGCVGVAGLADYCAGKWAAVGFDEALRAELRETAPGVMTTIVCPYYVNTGMFRGVKTRFPWLLPILDEEYVAERIVRAIRRNRRRLLMPRAVHLVPALRVLPLRWFDAIVGFLGINRSMDHFVGRK